MLGALTARSEAQAVRLALVFALLDRCGEISTDHLRAALALWEYADASALYIWGDALGDPVADEIMRALRQAGTAGRTRTELRDLFGRHRTAVDISRALPRWLRPARRHASLGQTPAAAQQNFGLRRSRDNGSLSRSASRPGR